jgi:hypothetical protein
MVEKQVSPRSLKQVLHDRIKGVVTTIEPSTVEGISLKLESGTELNPSKTTIRGLARASRKVNRFKKQEAKAKNDRSDISRELTDYARENSGFRGLILDDELSVTVYPSNDITYNYPKLKKALKASASTVVSEDLQATISIPLGHETPDGPLSGKMVRDALEGTVRGLGFSKRATRTILHSVIDYRVDEPKLYELMSNDQVRIPDSAAGIEETLKVRTDELN